MYPLNDSTSASYLAHSRVEEAVAHAERSRMVREARAAGQLRDDAPGHRRRRSWYRRRTAAVPA